MERLLKVKKYGPSVRGESGTSVTELIFATAVSILVLVSLTTHVSHVFAKDSEIRMHSQLIEVRKDLFLTLISNQARENTVNHPDNTAFSCLQDNADCEGQGGPFKLYDASNNLILDPITNPTSGLTMDGRPCTGFSLEHGNPACPLRLVTHWEPQCGSPCDGNLMAKMEIELLFSPGPNLKTVMNPTNFNLRVSRPFERSTAEVGDLLVAWDRTMARLADGRVMSWGDNNYGSAGVGSNADNIATPAQIVDSAGNPITDVEHMAENPSSHACVLRTGGGVSCTGNRRDLAQGMDIGPQNHFLDAIDVGQGFGGSPLSGVDFVSSAPYSLTIALKNKKLLGWGANLRNRLALSSDAGYEGTAYENSPTHYSPQVSDIMGGIDFKMVAAGYWHICGIIDGSGEITCWGVNSQAQVGVGNATPGTTTMAPDPTRRVRYSNGDIVTGAVYIATGWYHTCALLDTKEVVCWGGNDYHQLGRRPGGAQRGYADHVVSPHNPSQHLSNIEVIGVGVLGSCAVDTAGDVWCWGPNDFGQLGNGTTSAGSSRPVKALLPKPATDAGQGHTHACALLEGREIWCWGQNDQGQLGQGTFGGTSLTPVQVNFSE